jgi:hypothetical protein
MPSNRVGPWDTTGPAGSDGTGGSGNIIINGDFNIWQRGASFVAPGDGDKTSDRFRYLGNGDMVHTVSRDADTPTQSQSGHESNYSYKVDCTTADAVIAIDAYTFLDYRVEGYNLIQLIGNEATLSFWVKAPKVGTYCISFRNGDATRSQVVEYTISDVDTWEKKTITLTFDSDGTWNRVNGLGLIIGWTIAAGSNYNTTPYVWQTGNYFSTSNQVNACDNVSNDFNISQIKLELGPSATPFISKSIREEVSDCQRYFQKTYDIDVDPGTVDNNGRVLSYSSGHSNADHTMKLTWNLPTRMRNTPTLVSYSSLDGALGKVFMISGEVNAVAGAIGESSIILQGTNGAASTDRLIHFHATVDAEL